jgi:hypothetical protein
MPDAALRPWSELSDKAMLALQVGLGSLWKNASESEPFVRSVAEDVARELWLESRAKDDAERELHALNVQIDIDSAALRAARIGVLAEHVAADTANQILKAGLQVLAGFLRQILSSGMWSRK